MEHFLPFFITLVAGLAFSVAFKRFQVPWVVSLIVAGMVIGPHGLSWFKMNETIHFISQSGLVLLMFMAGLETRLSSFKKLRKKLYILAFLNSMIPFAVGMGIMLVLGFPLISALLVGIIFMSSSVAVVIPSLEANGLINKPLGSSVLATAIIADVASLILLSMFLQTEQRIANVPLVIFYPLLFAGLYLLKTFLPRVQKFFLTKIMKENDIFEKDLRVVLFMLFGMVIIFELLGLHPIIAGFFTGLVLSESLESKVLLGKIHAISYGIFIPTFFIVIGMETNIRQFFEASDIIFLTLLIVMGSMLSKFLSGTLAARLVGFTPSQSVFFGVASTPQLSTTLAATFTGLEFGLITSKIATAMVILSVISTMIGPLLMSVLNKYVLSSKDIKQTHQEGA